MMIEDRGGRGSDELAGAVMAMMGKAAQTPGCQQRLSRCSRLRRRSSIVDIDRTKAQMLGIRMPDGFGALQTFLAPPMSTLQSPGPHVPRHRSGR